MHPVPLRPPADLAHPNVPGTTTVLVSLTLLAAATGWSWWCHRRRSGSRQSAAAGLAVLLASAQWLAVDPVHAPTIVTIAESHGVTPGDLLVLPGLAALGALVVHARRRRATARQLDEARRAT